MAGRPIRALFSILFSRQTAFVNHGHVFSLSHARAFLLARRVYARAMRASKRESFPGKRANERITRETDEIIPAHSRFLSLRRGDFFSLDSERVFLALTTRSFRGETRRVAFFIRPNPPSLTQCTVSLSSSLKSLPFSSRRDVYERRLKSSGFTIILPYLRATRCSHSAIPAFIAARIAAPSILSACFTPRADFPRLLRREIPVDMAAKMTAIKRLYAATYSAKGSLGFRKSEILHRISRRRIFYLASTFRTFFFNTLYARAREEREDATDYFSREKEKKILAS